MAHSLSITNFYIAFLAHWHFKPFLHIFYTSTINLRIILMLSNNNTVTREHIKHANKIFQQFHNTIKFIKNNTFSKSTNILDPSMINTFSHSDNWSDQIWLLSAYSQFHNLSNIFSSGSWLSLVPISFGNLTLNSESVQCLVSHTMPTHTFESCHPDMLFKYHQIWGNLSHHLSPVSQTCCSNFTFQVSSNSNLSLICQSTLKITMQIKFQIFSWSTLRTHFCQSTLVIHLAIKFLCLLPIHFKDYYASFNQIIASWTI